MGLIHYVYSIKRDPATKRPIKAPNQYRDLPSVLFLSIIKTKPQNAVWQWRGLQANFKQTNIVSPLSNAILSATVNGSELMRLSYCQETLVPGRGEPAAAALLEQLRQMPSAAHVQARGDPGQGHRG